MVLETELLPLGEWLRTALPVWLLIVGVGAVAAMAIGFFAAALVHGPDRAGEMTYRLLSGAFVDLVRMSPRRIWALSRLAVQESLRRHVLVGLGVFLAILAFAIWFLDARTDDPATLYLDFVLTATTYLVLLMVLFLSAFSLPNDIRHHTIYTVVTKPVRPSEIVLGRIVGFTLVGTAMLALMALVSYMFVVRGLNHTHELTSADLTVVGESDAAQAGQRTGRTGNTRGHRHRVTIDADGTGTTDVVQGHWHEVTEQGQGDSRRYVVGPAEGQFHARVPVYGKLTFRDRSGAPKREGISVGNEWSYRSYIEGGTVAAAIWDFAGIDRDDFPEGLPINMTIRVFRTHKGNIEETVAGSFILRNPRSGLKSEPFNFLAKEYAIYEDLVPLELSDADGNPISLYDDLIDDGRLQIELICLQAGQYFGMAQPDLYLLPREASFEWNFVKGYAAIWLQMVLLTSFGVMWSAFLNGAVAMLATLSTLIGGMFVGWMQEVATGEVIGGGPSEAFLRTVTQTSITAELDEGLTASVVRWFDYLAQWPLRLVSRLVPDFTAMSDTAFVSAGFNIPIDLLVQQALTTLGYVIPVFIFGFLCLKMREVAK